MLGSAGTATAGATTTGGAAATGGVTASGGVAGAAGALTPALLSDAGLYEADMVTLAPGVRAYAPRFELWSDGATKRRWVYLPPGAQIDTSDMDYWVYPQGTKLFKEFSRDGLRIETRLLEKLGDQDWRMVAYLWNEAGTDAVAIPDGQPNAHGTQHDVPSEAQCSTCHRNVPDRVLGASALQLAHAGSGLTLDTLVAEGRLTDPPLGPLTLPGDATAQAALGALHANCGTCHNPHTALPTSGLRMWLEVADLASVTTTGAYTSLVGVPTLSLPTPDTPALLIAPGDPAASAVLYRMQSRELGVGMPPLGSELPDPQGIEAVRAWIAALPP